MAGALLFWGAYSAPVFGKKPYTLPQVYAIKRQCVGKYSNISDCLSSIRLVEKNAQHVPNMEELGRGSVKNIESPSTEHDLKPKSRHMLATSGAPGSGGRAGDNLLYAYPAPTVPKLPIRS